MTQTFDPFFQLMAEQFARAVDRKSYLKLLLRAAFTKMMEISLKPASAFVASATSWCEVWTYMCDCYPPGGRYCSHCPSHGSNAKCPNGYTVWKGIYRSTGCWCATSDGCPYYFVCCDCIKNGHICGCKWAFRI